MVEEDTGRRVEVTFACMPHRAFTSRTASVFRALTRSELDGDRTIRRSEADDSTLWRYRDLTHCISDLRS